MVRTAAGEGGGGVITGPQAILIEDPWYADNNIKLYKYQFSVSTPNNTL